MKGSGLKVLIILFDIVLLLALAAAVYFSYFDKRYSVKVPDVLAEASITVPRALNNQAGLSGTQIERISTVLSPIKVEKVEPGKTDPNSDTKESKTELDNLIVLGVIEDKSAPEDSCAILYDKEDNKQENLYVGDEYKGWKLKQVIDRVTVLLERNGEEKTIKKTDEKVAMVTGAAKPGVPNPNPNMPGMNNPANRFPNQPNNPNMPNNPAVANPNAPARTTNVTRNIRREFLKELSSSFDARMQEVYAKPFVVNGRSVGMQVSRIDPKSPLMAFGVQQGDVIKSWNGIPITSEKQALDIAAKYRQNVDAIPSANEITVLRGGTEIRLNIQLR